VGVTAARAEYRILGPLEVLQDGRPIDLTAGRPRTLLVCLLLRRGEVVPTDLLTDALWGAQPPPSWSNLVQVYVSQLRRALPAAAIETRRPGYVLHAASDEVDAGRFEDLLTEGRQALDANPQVASSLLRRALALWRGPALAGFAYADFAVAEANRLEELRLVCLEERVAADLALGRHQAVLGELTGLVGEHPHRERLCGHLMLALYRSGRQADALDVYRRTRRALREELGLDPGPELRELEQAILRHDSVLASPERAEVAALPRPPTPANRLVGRERELEALHTLVERRDVRLVTLAGAGGSGKTRLAFAFAEQAGSLFANGVAVVELATLREAELIVPTLAEALGGVPVPDVPLERTLAASLAEQQLLLVLDNLEHLPGCEEVIARLLAAARRVTVLATSRRVLHISGEHVFPVQPLAEEDAIALFVDRARARDHTFTLSPPQEDAVREICRRLDGLPLAIELAAARTHTLAPQELLERLVPRLTLLTGGPRDLPARQQTLLDTLRWSTDLLTPAERRDLFRLGVFEGGFTLEAAEAVASTDVDRVGTLVDHHLLRRLEGAQGARFAMLETVREYALERLETEGDATAARQPHADYYLSLAERRRGEVDERGGLLTPLATLEPEHANLRAALTHFRATADMSSELRLCAALWHFWWLTGHIAEGRHQVELALARSAGLETVARARLLRGAARLEHRQGDYHAAAALAEQSAELARALNEPLALAEALMAHGNAVSSLGEYEQAERLYAESAELFRSTDVHWEFATLLMNMGDLALARGDLEEAERRAGESLDHCRRSRDDAGIAANLGNMAFVALERDEAERALELFSEALRRSHELGFGEWIAIMLAGLAAVAVSHDEPARAARLLGAAGRLREELGVSLDAVEERVHARTSSRLRERLDAETLASALAEGHELSTDEAVAFGLSPEQK
jgi:predicted ATPase/DNA-binding winged helix-turn-helix (wHTH) protein